jgi:uncharacterized protein YjbJ (UPF0337 family)
MNRNRVKGTIEKLTGNAKRKAGKLTGNTSLQVEGIVRQAKGTLRNTLGKVEEAIDGANRRSSTKPR